jgi:hypothetical protein
MKLLCQAAHVYQERRFVAGEVYDFADDIATRLLHDYGPMAEGDTRGGHEVRFVVAPAEPTEEPNESATTEPADVSVETATAEASAPAPAEKPKDRHSKPPAPTKPKAQPVKKERTQRGT